MPKKLRHLLMTNETHDLTPMVFIRAYPNLKNDDDEDAAWPAPGTRIILVLPYQDQYRAEEMIPGEDHKYRMRIDLNQSLGFNTYNKLYNWSAHLAIGLGTLGRRDIPCPILDMSCFQK